MLFSIEVIQNFETDFIRKDLQTFGTQICEIQILKNLRKFLNSFIAVIIIEAIMENCRFIDLFVGIGRIRLELETKKTECVFSSKWNKYAQQTY